MPRVPVATERGVGALWIPVATEPGVSADLSRELCTGMFTILVAFAFAQDAEPPAAEPAGWSSGSYGASYDPGGEPPPIGDLLAPGYCSLRKAAVAANAGGQHGEFGNFWRGSSDKPTKAHESNGLQFAVWRASTNDVCVEVALGAQGSYDARHAAAYARAQAIQKYSDPVYAENPGPWTRTLPIAPYDGGAHTGGIVVVITDTESDPSIAAGHLTWDVWPSQDGRPASTDWVAADAAPVASPTVAPAPVPARVATAAPVVTPTVSAPTSTALQLPSIDGRLATGRKASNEAAVVIGLEDYAFVPDVPYARRDADAFYNFLLYTRGVPRDRIAVITSGSVEHIRKAVEDTGRSVSTGGTVWVYFAGHGAASPSSRQQVVLGDDVRPDDVSFDARSVPVADIQRLATGGGGNAMLVVDACFSGVGRDGSSLLGGHRTLIPAKALQAVASARQWTATTAGEASVPLDSVQHGAFTYAAVGALRGWADGELGAKDGKVTADEADAYVARLLRAMQVRDQSPQFTGGTEIVLSEGATEVGPLQ